MAINISAETLGLTLQDSNILRRYFGFFSEKFEKLAHIASAISPLELPCEQW